MKIVNKLQLFWKKITSYRIIFINNNDNKWTLYKKLHKKLHIDHKLMKEICEFYGNKFQNLVEYEKMGKTKEGYTIWKIKQ